MKKIKSENLFLFGIIAVSIALLLPLVVLSFYNHPSADDFSYSLDTHKVWLATHSITALIKQAFNTSIGYWHTWQGLYFSAFMLSLQPGLFGESCYALASIFIIFCLCGASIFFCYYMLHKKLDFSKLEATAFGFLLSMLCIQWMPSAVQGIYWFNGAGNYTFFFAVLLILAVCLVSIGTNKTSGTKICSAKLCLKIVLASIVAFVLSGGNHVTAFIGFLMVLGVVIYGFIAKKNLFFKGNLIPLFFSAAGLALNFLSPGTKVRQSMFQKSGFAKTIVLATFRGFENKSNWMNIAILLSIFLMLPFLYRGAARLVESKKCKFDKPLLVLILGAAWPCLMFCPPIYALGHEGDGRLLNVIYFSIVFISFIEVFYVCGWLSSKFKAELTCIFETLKPKNKLFLSIFVLFIFMTFFCSSARSSYGFQAAAIIANGRAAQFDREAKNRTRLSLESKGQDLTVEPFSVKPSLLFLQDLIDDPNEWPNNDYARFYGLKSVKISN